jgi:hypothetical protein
MLELPTRSAPPTAKSASTATSFSTLGFGFFLVADEFGEAMVLPFRFKIIL